jgi:putative ABC transport system permease protein
MNRLTRAWRAHGPASSGFGLLVLVCVFLAVAGPRADLALRTQALQQSLATTTPVARSVYATLDDTGFSANLGELPSAKSLAATGTLLRSNLMRDHLPLAGTADDWSGLASPFFPVSSGLPPAFLHPLPTMLELAYRSGLSGEAAVAAGHLPSAAHVAGGRATFEIAVTAATAARFGLRTGSRIQGTAGTALTAVVTAVLRPSAANPTFWTADPALAIPRSQQVSPDLPPEWFGGAFVGADELPLLQQAFDRASTTTSWNFPLVTGVVTADSAPALSGALTRVVDEGGLLGTGAAPVRLSAGVATTLGRFITADESAGSVLQLLAVSLAVIAVVAVLLGGQSVARRRRGELSVLRARGASRAQVTLLTLRAAALPALGGAAAGTALAIALTPDHLDPLPWWLGGATLLAALASAPASAFWEHRAPGRHGSRLASGRPGVPAAVQAAWRRVAAELTLTAAAVAAVVVLRQHGVGAYPSLAPALIAVPAAIVVMRCYPLAVRGLLRLARLRPGAVAFTGLAQAARTSRGAVVPGFALVLALTVAAFGIMVRDAVISGETAVSWQHNGADALIDARLAYQPPGAAAEHAISAVPGVQHIAAVSLISSSLGYGSTLPVAVVQPQQYAALVAGTPLPPFPAAELARPASSSGAAAGAVPALATPAAKAAVGRATTIGIGLHNLPIRITGTISGISGVASGALLVLPAWAVSGTLAPPNFILVTGTHLDSSRLKAVVRHGLPGATVTLRSTALAALTSEPLPHDEYLAIVAASIAAAALALLALLIAIAASAPARRLTVARLRVIGLRGGQARWIEVTQMLPFVVAAAAGGAACARVLGPLIGPALDLSAFTGGDPVRIGAQWVLLGAAAAGLVLLALLVLIAEAVAAERQGTRAMLAIKE